MARSGIAKSGIAKSGTAKTFCDTGVKSGFGMADEGLKQASASLKEQHRSAENAKDRAQLNLRIKAVETLAKATKVARFFVFKQP
jgi:hypothetical protein